MGYIWAMLKWGVLRKLVSSQFILRQNSFPPSKKVRHEHTKTRNGSLFQMRWYCELCPSCPLWYTPIMKFAVQHYKEGRRFPMRSDEHFGRFFGLIREYLDALDKGVFNYRPSSNDLLHQFFVFIGACADENNFP